MVIRLSLCNCQIRKAPGNGAVILTSRNTSDRCIGYYIYLCVAVLDRAEITSREGSGFGVRAQRTVNNRAVPDDTVFPVLSRDNTQ